LSAGRHRFEGGCARQRELSNALLRPTKGIMTFDVQVIDTHDRPQKGRCVKVILKPDRFPLFPVGGEITEYSDEEGHAKFDTSEPAHWISPASAGLRQLTLGPGLPGHFEAEKASLSHQDVRRWPPCQAS